MAGWSYRASGNATDRGVVDKLASAFRAVFQHDAVAALGHDFTSDAHGWAASGHGQHDDPAVHQRIAYQLAAVMNDPAAQTGSSEFTSPHLQRVNYHTAPPVPPGAEEETPAAAPDAAAAAGGPGGAV